mmetsp:Transcript_12922/g.32967  ORF Transcript_12922/g.32967 Transcript_12922/m.32967 type:complete len:253 (+) Transcript_12922:1729-2487(+)
MLSPARPLVGLPVNFSPFSRTRLAFLSRYASLSEPFTFRRILSKQSKVPPGNSPTGVSSEGPCTFAPFSAFLSFTSFFFLAASSAAFLAAAASTPSRVLALASSSPTSSTSTSGMLMRSFSSISCFSVLLLTTSTPSFSLSLLVSSTVFFVSLPTATAAFMQFSPNLPKSMSSRSISMVPSFFVPAACTACTKNSIAWRMRLAWNGTRILSSEVSGKGSKRAIWMKMRDSTMSKPGLLCISVSWLDAFSMSS